MLYPSSSWHCHCKLRQELGFKLSQWEIVPSRCRVLVVYIFTREGKARGVGGKTNLKH